MTLIWGARTPETRAIGRNGSSFTRGLIVNAHEKHIVLFPVNSKHRATNCMIEIPYNAITAIITELQEIAKTHNHSL